MHNMIIEIPEIGEISEKLDRVMHHALDDHRGVSYQERGTRSFIVKKAVKKSASRDKWCAAR